VLYDRYADQLNRYAGRRLGHVDAEDMAPATFLAAFLRAQPVRHHAAQCPAIVVRHLNQGARKQHRKERLPAIARACTGASETGHAEAVPDGVTAWAARQQLAKALAVLAPADRSVLLLIAWCDLTGPAGTSECGRRWRRDGHAMPNCQRHDRRPDQGWR
jgi:RNA polymerase sigma-70 factor (ECF subfamily)